MQQLLAHHEKFPDSKRLRTPFAEKCRKGTSGEEIRRAGEYALAG
jgi:hypothetical protein